MIEDDNALLAMRASGACCCLIEDGEVLRTDDGCPLHSKRPGVRVALDPENWSFDVTTALHDDMKGGGRFRTVRSRVTVSRQEFPSWPTASEVAACMAVAHHGGMPIEILARY